ncbi:hypothetical protein PybrP1_003756 [[Pythium] brassicae (nom. inval.)]|nr:hypothetical protein PybrP1_003756 [[Pythium] brassicae (nom. inval.)]
MTAKHRRGELVCLPPWLWTTVIVAAIYAASPLRRLPGGDSAELMAEACVGGVAHPPGYPLLLSLLRLARWTTRQFTVLHAYMACQLHGCEDDAAAAVPMALVANVVNASFAVGAAASVTHVVDLWARREAAVEAVAAGLLFATSKLTWEYAIGLEVCAALLVLQLRLVCASFELVFALNNLLVGILHVLVLRHFLQPSARNAFAGAFVCGLGLANQHTIGAKCAAAVVAKISALVCVCIFLKQRTSSASLAPLSPASAPFSFSSDLFQRAQRCWTTWLLGGCCSPCVKCRHSLSMAHHCAQTHPPAPLRGYSRALHAAMACYLLVFHGLANIPLKDPLARAVSSRFALQPNTIVAISMGIGLVASIEWLRARVQSRALFLAARACVVGSLVAYQLSIGAQEFVRGANWRDDVIRSYGETVLRSLPANALLLSYTDINWNTVRYLQLCEYQRPDVTHLSLQLMPYPWFTRQHALYSLDPDFPASSSEPTVRFPAIRPGVSTVRTSAGYTTYLREFLAANLPQFKQGVFLDLHAVSDSDIGGGGYYHGVRLTPYGALWRVHPEMDDPEKLFKRWEAALARNLLQPRLGAVTSAHTSQDSARRDTQLTFPRGSWEFVALKIAVDGEYQAALFRLEHWLGRATGATKDLNSLVAFVLGTHTATLALDRVVARATPRSLGEGDDGALITYPIFDARKNAVVARMRFQAGLEVLDKVVRSAKRPGRAVVRSSSGRKLFVELVDELLPRIHELRQAALVAVAALLPELRARSDEHVDAFIGFVRQHSTPKSERDEDEFGESYSKRVAARAKKATKKSKRKSAGHSSVATARRSA